MSSAPNPPFPPYPPFPPLPPFPPFPPFPPEPCAPARELDGGTGDQQPSEVVAPGGAGEVSESVTLPSRIAVRRPDDLLIFDLIFVGFTLATGPARLERASSDAYVVVEFPPQSFGEQAFLEVAPEVTIEKDPKDITDVSSDPSYPKKNVTDTGGDEPIPAQLPAARVRMSGASRIALSMPSGTDEVPFQLDSVLTALSDWPMRLDYSAVGDLSGMLGPIGVLPGPLPPLVLGPHEPAATVTALEVPYRLVLSPVAPAGWRHRSDVRFDGGRTELWHTRLSSSNEAVGVDAASRIRAIWSPDYRPYDELNELIALISVQPEPSTGPAPNPNLLRMSLDPLDRSMLVTLMAGFDAKTGAGLDYQPLSSAANRLHLSALGALLDTEGTWVTRPQGIDLEQWRHLATLGRDHYVRVMYAGYLCPFGHAASLIKVTERKFQPIAAGSTNRIAILRQRFFIVVREPVRVFTGAGHQYHGNNFPFRSVEILTRVTPNLNEPGAGDGAVKTNPPHTNPPYNLPDRMLFWPMVPGPGPGNQIDVLFDIAATDVLGNRTTFSMPLLFVSEVADADPTISEALRNAYNATAADPRRRASTGTAVVAYAPVVGSGGTDGDPRLPTTTITFAAGKTSEHPKFYPEVDRAEVGVKPIQKLLSMPGFVVEVTYPQFVKDHGLDPAHNAAQIYLQLTSAQPVTFGGLPSTAKSDTLGALASPQMNLLALSTTIGPVGGKAANDPAQVEANLADIGTGTFNPVEFFNDAKILGGISLADILPTVTSLSGPQVPRMLTADFPDRTDASFQWSTEVDGANTNLLIPQADLQKPPTRLTMSGVVSTPIDPTKAATADATASLNNFKINLFGFIILWFEQLTFVAKNGQKPDVTVQLRDGEDAVQFGGPLEFVNTLRKYIPSNGFSDPPSLAVTPSGISASYSLTLPAIEVGILAVSNVSLGAAFNLPFDSQPASVKFNFSERQQPFSLTVSLLSGGGYLAIGVSSQGVDEIEAALEFGAEIAIDLGVASGSVEVKAGIYFHWLQPPPAPTGSVELAGYVRIHGELSVLAIISVSLTFNLQLGYQKANGKSLVYGEATLQVEIDILMFSESVSVKCRREFQGGAADPKFIDLIPTQEIWSEYCNAFALES